MQRGRRETAGGWIVIEFYCVECDMGVAIHFPKQGFTRTELTKAHEQIAALHADLKLQKQTIRTFSRARQV
jgi:hypothetical protein